MDGTLTPVVTLVLPETGHGLKKTYQAAFADSGWIVETADGPEAAAGKDGLLIADFDMAATHSAAFLAAPCAMLALDIHYKAEFFRDPMAHPFHLLDNAVALVHDHETREFIRNVVRPVNCRLVMIPYPNQPPSIIENSGPRKIYAPAPLAGHPWLAGMDVEPFESIPEKVSAGSFVVVPEYIPETWKLIHWAMATGLPAVLPGTVSFQKTCFYGALLFDPLSEDDFIAKIGVMDRPIPAKPSGPSLRLAMVTPRHEKQTAGGAENHAARLAESFTAAGHRADILTTRTTSMLDWNNNLPEGAEMVDGVMVRRFAMDNLEATEYHRLGHMINTRRELDWTEQTEFLRLGIRSTALDEYIAAHTEDYDYFFFVPYLYGTAYWASHRAPEKSLLIPCYHREPEATLKALNQNAQWMTGLMFNTAAELKLAREELKIHNPNMMVVGVGVETSEPGDAVRFRAKFGLEGEFILYVGRFQREKGLDDLVNQFKQYVDETGSKVTLALVGRGDMQVTDDPAHNIRVLGFLAEQDKLDAAAACSALALPSIRESFSIVMMEAWAQGRPVIAAGRCDAAREHIYTCQGGLLYDDAKELGLCVDRIVNDKPAADEMGRRGREYVKANFQSTTIVENFVNALEGMSREPLTSRMGRAMAAAGAHQDNSRKNALERFMAEAWEKVTLTSPLAEESIQEILAKVEDFSDFSMNYTEFSHRKAVGGVWSKFRGAVTRHLRVNYLDIMEGKQRAFNREAANLLRRIYERIKDGA
ncbi:MAG: glycosyltransferase family 4 protein [Nitrospinota bacterium]|nr:glycosyltransferase family 4 protein [Nitrospinota bacterium]MDH5677090.1 glycosyltransferase family 4 protein [Nitrospinota bacterium]MDH5756290.1 glycosyltransferase family 4 protein [Nitrospinota bacterium]